MSNIKASLITNIGNPSLLRTYEAYISISDRSTRNILQQKLERVLGEQVFGAKKAVGDGRFEQDWYVDDIAAAKEIANNLGMFQIDKDGVLRIEAKLQIKQPRSSTIIGTSDGQLIISNKGRKASSTLTSIGGTVLFNKNTLDFSILKEIRRNLGSEDKLKTEKQAVAFENIILNQLEKKGTTSQSRFNFLEKNAPKTIHNPAYNKSKNLTIFSSTGKTSGSLQAYNIFFPRSKFKPPIFGVSVEKRTIKYEIQTPFEKALVSKLNTAATKGINDQNQKEQLDLQKSLASQLKAKTKTTSITFGQATNGVRPKENINIIYYTTNSMPVSKATIRGGRKLKFVDDGPSLIDLTAAVRGRTRLRMRRGAGTPRPPKIYERDGDFRSSIEAIVNLRANTIEYFYTPYYQRLEKYGYEITDLVEGSIRGVAQAQFNRRFNLIRRNT